MPTTAATTIMAMTMEAPGDRDGVVGAGGGRRVRTPMRRCPSTSRKTRALVVVVVVVVVVVAHSRAPDLPAESASVCGTA